MSHFPYLRGGGGRVFPGLSSRVWSFVAQLNYYRFLYIFLSWGLSAVPLVCFPCCVFVCLRYFNAFCLLWWHFYTRWSCFPSYSDNLSRPRRWIRNVTFQGQNRVKRSSAGLIQRIKRFYTDLSSFLSACVVAGGGGVRLVDRKKLGWVSGLTNVTCLVF